MMRLGDERPPAALESFEHHDVPEWSRAVEAVGPVVAEPLAQLLLSAGRRQRRVPDMRRYVEALVVFPGRPAESARARRRKPPVVTREIPEARVQMCPKLFNRRSRAVGASVEDQRTTDVHGRGLVLLLELEEGRVEWCQAVGQLSANLARPECLRVSIFPPP